MFEASPHNKNIYEVKTVALTNPGAGANFSWAVPDNSRVEIISCNFQITADGNAANRQVQVKGDDGTYDFCYSVSPGVQTATELIYYNFAIDIEPRDLSGAYDLMNCKLASNMELSGGETFDSAIADIQVGDQIANVVIRYRQWITP